VFTIFLISRTSEDKDSQENLMHTLYFKYNYDPYGRPHGPVYSRYITSP